LHIELTKPYNVVEIGKGLVVHTFAYLRVAEFRMH
jgi:hypothetical protein